MTVLLRLALRNLWRNPRRTLLTAGATFFAVSLAILMESMAAGSHKNWIEEVVRLYSGHVEVMTRGYRDNRTLDYGMRLDTVKEAILDRLPRVEGWAPRVESWALVMPDKEGALGRAAWVVGVDPKKEISLSKLSGTLREGSFLDGKPGLVLGYSLARSLGVGVGDSVILLSSSYYGSLAAERFPVLGTLEVGTREFDSGLVLLELSQLQEFLEYKDQVSHVAVFAEQTDATDAVAAGARAVFDPAAFDVLRWPDLMPELAQLIVLDDAGNRLTLAILILVAGFGLLNTVLMSVFERVHEFGLMRAMGARPRTLFGCVMLEATLLGLLGIAFGLAVSVPLVLWLEGSPIPLSGLTAQAIEAFSVEPTLVFDLERKNLIGAPMIMLGVGLLAAIPPAVRASRGQPVDVMRADRV